MPDEMHGVMASYHRCREDEQFFDTFYKTFLGKSEEVAALFRHTDFKRQKLMLRESLLEMLCYDRGMEGVEEEIRKLGQRHRELGVKDEMYAMWLDSLCETVAKYDSEYSPKLEQAWRAAMQKGIDVMLKE